FSSTPLGHSFTTPSRTCPIFALFFLCATADHFIPPPSRRFLFLNFALFHSLSLPPPPHTPKRFANTTISLYISRITDRPPKYAVPANHFVAPLLPKSVL